MSRPTCKACNFNLTYRRARKTFFERVVMFKLGQHPWQCSLCRASFWSKERGYKSSSRRSHETPTGDRCPDLNPSTPELVTDDPARQ